MFSVTNELSYSAYSGVTFNVRVVPVGARYGRYDTQLHEGGEGFRGDPLIEFYDARFPFDGPNGERGQFVARYYLSSLNFNRALVLQGDVSAWTVDAQSMRLVGNILDALGYIDTEPEPEASDISKNLRRLLDAGPSEGEDFYRLKVTGNGETRWMNITPTQLEAIARLL